MSYALTKPCKDCPFRHDIRPFLRRARAEEIVEGLERGEFPCHKTLECTDDEEGTRVGKKSQHCAGALIMLEKVDRPSQMMRIAERIGMYDRTKLDMDAPVFDDPQDFIDAQE